MMLKPGTVGTVKATAPAVEGHAEQVMPRFYELMFAGNPQVRDYFNQADQHRGRAAACPGHGDRGLRGDVDDLQALGPGVELIAQKHCSLVIKPEHYPIVGTTGR